MHHYLKHRGNTLAHVAGQVVRSGLFLLALAGAFVAPGAEVAANTTAVGNVLQIVGVHLVPHVQSTEMKYRQEPDFSLGARVEVFLQNTSATELSIPADANIRLRGQSPEDLLKAD